MIWHTLFDIGVSMLTCVGMEQYYQRREANKIYEFENPERRH